MGISRGFNVDAPEDKVGNSTARQRVSFDLWKSVDSARGKKLPLTRDFALGSTIHSTYLYSYLLKNKTSELGAR